MATNTFLGALVENGVELVAPLKEALSDASRFRKLLRELGWDLPNPPVTQAQQVVTAIQTLITNFKSLPSSPSETDVLSLLDDIKDVYTAVKAFVNAVPSSTAGIGSALSTFVNEFPSDLSNYLIVVYLEKKSPAAYNILKLFGIIESYSVNAVSPRPAYTKIKINWAKFSQLISNPLSLFKTTINWNASAFSIDFLFNLLSGYLASQRIPAVVSDEDRLPNIIAFNKAFNNTDIIGSTLHIYLVDVLIGSFYQHLGLQLTSAQGTTLADTGVVLQLDIPSGVSTTQKIGKGLDLELNLASAAGKAYALMIKPNGVVFKNTSPTEFPDTRLTVALKYHPDTPKILFGKLEGTRLQVKDLSLVLEGDLNDDLEVAAELDLTGISLIIDPGEADNFISKILNGEKKEIAVPLVIRWSSKTGITFKGSGSFEYRLNTRFKIGPLEFQDVVAALKAPSGQNKVLADVATSIAGTVGPLSFTVTNLGLRLQLDLTEGNAGPFGIRIGVKPPTGIGLSINTSSVTGGGFLNFDENTSTYTGGLELKFSKISLKAIGILTTKMPDGGDGYSLLIIITAEFTPIQLGFGFTLNGVGGLLGLNRTMDKERLRTGIRDSTLDSILFPQDIVKNANTIVSNVSQAFPVKRDRFLIGPMAKIGWGTPTLLTIDLGIIIELPSPVTLAILGVVKAILPSKSNPILKLQVNFFGYIDFEKKQLSFDASLYDSSVLSFALQGDMALRLYWGEKANFLLSVGGFHSKYTPPPMNLPTLRRLAIIFADDDDLSVKLQGFFAITSNTVQFGASIEAHASAGSLEASAYVGFEVLVQFSPFHFIASMEIDVSLKWKGNNIAGMHISLNFEGPHPWRVQGRGTVDFWLFSVDFSFDKTIGTAQSESRDAVDVLPTLIAAIQNKDNWQVVGPDRSHQVVSFRDITTSVGANIVVDPFGALVFSQKVVPLDIKIVKYATSAVRDYTRFSIGSVTLPGTSPLVSLPIGAVQDYFAPESFFYLLPDQKLSRDSYERYNSGATIGNTDKIAFDFFIHRQLTYEEIIIDMRQRRRLSLYALQQLEQAVHVRNSYVTRGELSGSDTRKPLNGPRSVRIEDESYTLAYKDSLAAVNASLQFDSLTQASEYLESLRGVDPNFSNYMPVNASEI